MARFGTKSVVAVPLVVVLICAVYSTSRMGTGAAFPRGPLFAALSRAQNSADGTPPEADSVAEHGTPRAGPRGQISKLSEMPRAEEQRASVPRQTLSIHDIEQTLAKSGSKSFAKSQKKGAALAASPKISEKGDAKNKQVETFFAEHPEALKGITEKK